MENYSILNELYSLFIFIISGIVIGIFFDIFRILRKSFKTPDIVTYIEDVLFWILTGIFLLFIIFVFQNGQIRGYTIIGIITRNYIIHYYYKQIFHKNKCIYNKIYKRYNS